VRGFGTGRWQNWIGRRTPDETALTISTMIPLGRVATYAADGENGLHSHPNHGHRRTSSEDVG
jgi:hypothetical protein